MKKYLLILLLFINILGYSQQANVGVLDNGSRTVTFVNPSIINVTDIIETNSTVTDPTPQRTANGKIEFTISGGTPFTSGDAYQLSLKKGIDEILTSINYSINLETGNKYKITITGLDEGAYNATIEDSKGCSPSSQPSFTIHKPSSIQVNTISPYTIECFGDKGTLVSNSISGGAPYAGIPSYYYEWYKLVSGTTFTKIYQTTFNADNLLPGTYKVVVTDDYGNSAESALVNVTENPQIQANAIVKNASCKGGAGEISLQISNAVSPYIITWTDTNSTAVITNDGRILNDVSGTYQYTIKDAKGCTFVNTASINEPTSNLDVTHSFKQPTLAGNNGEITVNATGGILLNGPVTYTYEWIKVGDPTFTTQNVNKRSDLGNGTYNIVVTSSSGCVFPTIQIRLEALNINLVQKTDVKCYSYPTGSITIKGNGGTVITDYNYKWFKNGTEITGEITPALTGLTIGTYRVEVQDNNGDSVDNTYTIGQPTGPLTVVNNNLLQKDVSCNAGNNGAIAITVTGGTPGYTYSWNDGSTAKDRTNLVAGVYSVTVTDANGCIQTLNGITILEPSKISISAPSIKDIAINGQNTGSIVFSADPTGGNGGYTYKWTSSTNTNFSASTRDLSNLTAGTYQLIVSDNKTCESTLQTFTVQEKLKLTVNINKTALIKCNGDLNGELTAEITGGIAPYKYIWKKNGQVLSGQNTQTISGLGFGSYSVSVTDTANPEPAGPFAQAEQLNFALIQPDKLTVSVTKQTNVLCYGAQTGEIEIAIQGGTAPYTQKWTKNGVNYSGNLNTLEAGFYNVIVTDALNHSCTATLIQPVEITQPSAPLKIVSAALINLTGFETNNGSIAVTISGGTPTYKYEWRKDANSAIIGTTSSINNLSIGTYHLIVKDANDCALPQVDYTITQPDKLEITSLVQTSGSIKCYGDSIVEFTATVKGGVKEYTFEWLNTTTGLKYTSTETITPTITTSKASNLGAGNYLVSIKDKENNTLFGTNTFTILQPEKLAFTYTKENVSCLGGNNGTVIVNITGGTKNTDITKPYTIISSGGTADNQNGIVSGLTAGTYTIKITDFNGCQTPEQTIVISEPQNSVYISNEIITPTTGFGLATGKIEITVAGGTSGYAYQWKNNSGSTVGTNGPTLNGVPAGIYAVLVTDSKNCTTSNSYTIQQPTKPTLTETHMQSKCNGLLGSLEAVADGGASLVQNQSDRIYTYKLKNKISGNITTITGNIASFTNIPDGDYSLTATDVSGIDTNTIDVQFTQPSPIVVSLASKSNVRCFGDKDGAIAISVSGGTPLLLANGNTEYKYQWKKKNTVTNNYENFTPTALTSLLQGIYAVEVRDANYNAGDVSHCVGILDNIEITQPADFSFDIDKITYKNPSAVNGNDGTLHFEITGGKSNYEYKFYTKAITGNETVITTISNSSLKTVDFNGLIKDHYYISAKDDTGCIKYADFDFSDNPLTVSISQTQQITCYDANNGVLNVNANGGFGTKTISWYQNNVLLSNEDKENLLNVKPGTYYAIIKDSNKVEVTSNTINVNQPDIVVFSSIQEPVKCIGDSNGIINLNASGGNGNFRYRYFYKGSSIKDWQNFSNGANTTISDLAEGEYTIQVQDTQQCKSTDGVIKITSPTALTISNTVYIPTTGNGLSNGSIAVTPQGGNGSYTYQWFKSDNSTINQITNTAENLSAGKYYVIITDAKGCNLTSPLLEVTEPQLLETSIAVQNVILCSGNKNGSLQPTTIGGILKPGDNYTYKWYEDGNATLLGTTTILSSIGKGSYYVIATDSNGNEAKSKSLVVTEPAILANTLTSDYTLCGDANNWTIDANPSGGTAPYTYSWNNEIKTSYLQNVPPANYSVKITDSHGCDITQNITITAPVHLAAAESITIPTCYGGSDATIEVTSSGGKAPYTYLWNTGEKSNILSSVAAGDYSVTITDSKGCIVNYNYKIDNPSKDVIDLGEDVTLCFDQTLTINATINDDKATYSWKSDKGFTSNKAMITISEPANYTVTVTNKLGCEATDTIKIEGQNTAISAEFAVSSQVFKNEKIVIVDISSPAPDIIEWILPANATIISKNNDYAEISFSEIGEYEITLNTKKGNCTAFQTKQILVTEGEYEEEDPTDNAQKKFDLKIYPNPSQGIFTVDVTLDKVMPAHVKIYNLSNNLLIDSKTAEGKDNYLFNFSLSGLPSGLYFVLFESQQGSKLRKIIIQ
jgi:hypothetical protein